MHGGQLSRFVFSGPVGFGLMCLYSSHLSSHFRMEEKVVFLVSFASFSDSGASCFLMR